MHFHLPKPLHGWREFVGEVGIIVLGIVIALGGEQMVERAHWNHQVALERDALRKEANDMVGAIYWRGVQQGCIDRRLNEIAEVLKRHSSRKPLGIAGPVTAPSRISATRGSWPIALAGQTLVHMPAEEQLAWSDAFGIFDTWDEALNNHEYSNWLRLQPLDGADMLNETDWANLRAAYFAELKVNERIRSLVRYYLAHLGDRRLNLRLSDAEAEGIRKQSLAEPICKPMLEQ